MEMKNKLGKVKKRWLTFAVTAVTGLAFITVGADSVSADSQGQAQDSQSVQVGNENQATSDGNQAKVSNQDGEIPISLEANNQSEGQSQPTQSTSEASQDHHKSQVVETTNEVAPVQTDSTSDSTSQATELPSVAPASDGAVIQQAPQNQGSEEKPVAADANQEPATSVTTEAPTVTSNTQRADINKIVDGSSSGISTLDAAALTLEFEKARIKGATDANILAKIQEAGRAVPNNLTYLSDFYDDNTGTSGTAFRDKASNKVIIAYTATNNDGNELQDALGSDLIGIGLARGQHYQPAYDFYDKIAGQYGAENIVITGHSLGGNVAQRVALRKNVATTVVYNAAPLYIPALAYVGNKVYESLRKTFDLPSNKEEAKKTISDIKSDMKTFTGNVIRITTTKDWLNNSMRWLGAVYLSKEYVIPNSGNHDLQTIAGDAKQVASVKSQVSI
ncbi:YqiA/YcfP family alpha/beta fold hydrolase [Streptococcus downei]|uniref:Lipase n=1 Tax=Streptococcus downei MFe28 TaxID=764290 RepID=A0A380JBQ9_STRDO|nr:lipase [Streptococcus downei MFe28]